MTFQEALKVTQEANAAGGVTASKGMDPTENGEAFRHHFILTWDGLNLVTTVGIKHYPQYQDKVESGALTVGPAVFTKDGRTVGYLDDEVGLWNEG